jgi:NADPH2:quinone reductase
MKQLRAFRVHLQGSNLKYGLETLPLDSIEAGEVLIRVHYSSINYKDALGVTGKGKIFRKYPITPGIDAAGIIESSSDARFSPGQKVLVTGCGIGESRDGGYAEYIRVPAEWTVPLPENLSLQEAMMLGTAGFTAALSIERMEQNGQSPRKGTIVVTGASGGVGCLAISMLAQKGYQVCAVTGKKSQEAFLHSLGAHEVLAPEQLIVDTPKPLATSRWGGAIDNVGGPLLASILPELDLWANVACVGMAASSELVTSVMPFILRGVSVLGISSTNCPYPLRTKIWSRLASDLKPRHLGTIAQHEIALGELGEIFKKFLAREITGRYVVNCL